MMQQMGTKIPTQHDTYIQNPAEITSVRAITSGPSERLCYLCRGKSLHCIEDRLPHTLSVAAVPNLSFSAGGAIASAPSLQRKTASSACRHPGRAPWIGVSPACQAVAEPGSTSSLWVVEKYNRESPASRTSDHLSLERLRTGLPLTYDPNSTACRVKV